MLNITPYGKFKGVGKNKRKTQIILCHTSREVKDYLTSLTFRYNSKYNKIPHFVITRDDKVLQLLPEHSYSHFMWDENLNKNSIIVMIENLGWMEKKPLSNSHLNWIGDIYNQSVFEKKWRDYFLWQPYTPNQINLTSELCKKLTEENGIEKNFIGHNTRIEGAEKYEGILCRSNFDSMFTDLSPAFNFEELQKKLNHEQYTSNEI
mgnify:CR=1 FL=1